MPAAASRRLLLLCPQFFSYHLAILDAAERLGIAAQWVDARGGGSALYKGMLKLAPSLTRSASQAQIHAALDRVEDPAQITDILVVKGDGITPSTLDALRHRAHRARTTLYLWDSLRNASGALELSKLCDRTVTFDHGDAAMQGWDFVPLFSRAPVIDPGLVRDADWDWSFVGSVHSDRHRVLRRLAAALPGARYRVHAYVQNRLVQGVRALRDPGLLFPGPVGVARHVLGTSEYQDILNRSRAVVDVEHPRQVGLTMRTIETLLGGRKLITTNRHVQDYDIYDPTRVALIDREAPRLDPDFFETPFSPIPPAVAQLYHVDSWLERVLSRILPPTDQKL
jgi:hypothetical protein